MVVRIVGPSSSYHDIETALDAASQGDTIKLSPGYSGEIVTVTKNNITIDGELSSQNIVLTIGSGVSGLVLLGEAPINVTDSSGNDTVSGNDGANVITVTGGINVVDGGAGDWVLLDAGDIIVHVFRPEVREFYQLEKMWLTDPAEPQDV